MTLERIKVRGFKSLKDVDLELLDLNVLIGPNGAGKSNFLSLFRLLNEMIQGNFQLAVARAGGANALLFLGNDETERVELDLSFGPLDYACAWVPTERDQLVFASESVREGRAAAPFDLGSGHRETELHNARGVPGRDDIIQAFRGWKVYHFHDTGDAARVKKTGDIQDAAALRGDARNLAAFLFRMRRETPGHYDLIVRTVQRVAPFFGDFVLEPMPENEQKIRLQWREKGTDYPFMAHQLSDGTLRFICLATLLLQPRLPATLLIDEPELGLHPYAISILGGLMRSASARAQLVVSTQSVPLVDQFEPEDLLVVEREGLRPGAGLQTRIARPSGAGLRDWLDEYSIGELWQKNVLGGRP
jgi:predicted ATPase